MKDILKQILDEINGIKTFNKDTYENYKKTVIHIKTQLENLRQQQNNPILSMWIEMGIKELDHEINYRFGSSFNLHDKEKQKIEFLYSKTTVVLTLNNIIVHLN